MHRIRLLSILIGVNVLMTFVMCVLAKKGVFFPSVSMKPPLLDLGYKTHYACEGKTLDIKCDDGVIHLIRANYGRFSISICNDHGNLEWRVNCMSFESFPKMQDRCHLKRNCSVNVSSATFEDPCPGTLKYLEVQYKCGSVSDTPMILQQLSTLSPTSRSASVTNSSGVYSFEDRTPIFTPPSSTSNNSSHKSHALFTMSKPFTTVTKRFSTTTLRQNPTVATSKATQKATVNKSSKTHKSTPELYEILSPTIIIDTENDYCPSVFARGINWTLTKAGETAVMKCPDGASGFAVWHCDGNIIEWTPVKPNLQQCRSLWLENIKRQMEQGESIISVTSELALMSSAKPLFSEDLNDISDLIKQALIKGQSNMENVLDMWHRFRVLRELLQSLVQTLSNVIDDKQKEAWMDLSAQDQRTIISLLLEALEENALLLAETSSEDGSFSMSQDNVLISLQIVKIKDSSVRFPDFNDIQNDIYWTTMQDKVVLPANSLKEYSRHGLVKVVFTAYRNINKFLRPDSNILHYSNDGTSENNTRILNSRIVGAALEKSGNPKLSQPVIVTLKHIYEENATRPVCVYWDFHSRDWSARGCWLEKTNKTHTVCACDHLTNFAVIMEVRTDLVTETEIEVLQIVTLSGCVVAVFCLLVTVGVLCSLRAIGDIVVIEKNMFLCLLIAEIIFVAGIDQTKYHIVCAIIAGILQYIFLATFIWLFFLCYQQYVFVISAETPGKAQAHFFYAAAYILPAVIVGISAVIDPSSYGTRRYCWLHVDNYFVFSFVGPAVGILFAGFVFICISLFIFWYRSGLNTVVKRKDEVTLASIKFVSGKNMSLIILMSLTWTSGFLYINRRSAFLAYSFSLSNCLIGFFILLLYCVKNDKVIQEYKDVLNNQHILPCLQSVQKEQEPQNRVLSRMNSSTSGDNISQQFWNYHTGKSSSSMKCSSQGHLSTVPIRDNQEISDTPCIDNKRTAKTCEIPNSSQFKPELSRSGEIFMPDKSSIHRHPAGYHTLGFLHQAQYRRGTEVLDVNNQFKDHIYESIDDDEEPTSQSSKERSFTSGQYPPAENYYGDHSDLSQHSSSSYGYDQRPLLICGAQTRCTNSLQPYPIVGDSSDTLYSARKFPRGIKCYETEDGKFCTKECLNIGQCPTLKLPYGSSPRSGLHAQQNCIAKVSNTEVIGNLLPDLLPCPTDSPVVLAVLDGDKVVSQLQQEDVQNHQPKYKLSTYC